MSVHIEFPDYGRSSSFYLGRAYLILKWFGLWGLTSLVCLGFIPEVQLMICLRHITSKHDAPSSPLLARCARLQHGTQVSLEKGHANDSGTSRHNGICSFWISEMRRMQVTNKQKTNIVLALGATGGNRRKASKLYQSWRCRRRPTASTIMKIYQTLRQAGAFEKKKHRNSTISEDMKSTPWCSWLQILVLAFIA